MRRRIYIDPEGPLSDNTASPYLFDLRDDDEPVDRAMGWCRTGALYDDTLWARYIAAVDEERRLRRFVIAALRHEPYDAVERALHLRANEIIDGEYSNSAMEQLSAEAVLHAESLSPSGKEQA